MTLQECVAILAPLALALRAEMDDPTFRAYYRVLKGAPARLLDAAVDSLLTTELRFMPTAPELLAASEHTRRRLVEAHPHSGCIDCEESRGWVPIDVNGVQRVRRCPCFARWQQKLEQMGVTMQPLSMPVRQLTAVGDLE